MTQSIPGQSRVDAWSGIILVLPLVKIDRQPAAENDGCHLVTLDHGHRRLINVGVSLTGQRGNPFQRFVQGLVAEHDFAQLGEGDQRLAICEA